MNIGCNGNCNQGRSPCDCKRVDRDAIRDLGFTIIPFLCVLGILGVTIAIHMRWI